MYYPYCRGTTTVSLCLRPFEGCVAPTQAYLYLVSDTLSLWNRRPVLETNCLKFCVIGPHNGTAVLQGLITDPLASRYKLRA